MLKRYFYVATFSTLLIFPPLHAAPAENPISTLIGKVNAVTNPDFKAQVFEAYANWRKALSGGDAGAILALYKPDAVLLATLNNAPITNQKDRLTYFEGLVKRKGLKVAEQSEYFTLYGDSVALLSGLYTFSFSEKGKIVSIPARFTFVFEKEPDGKWLIAHHHSSKLPL